MHLFHQKAKNTIRSWAMSSFFLDKKNFELTSQKKICSIFLLGTTVSGVYSWSVPAWAQSPCKSIILQDCNVSGMFYGNLSIPAATNIDALTIADDGSIMGTSGSGYGIDNHGKITTLINSGYINSLYNETDGGIGSLVDSATIGSIKNAGSIGSLIYTGMIMDPGIQSIVNSGTITNTQSTQASNTGEIISLFGVGLYNRTDNSSLSNTGTITGDVSNVNAITGTAANQSFSVGIYNDISGVLATTNNGIIIGNGDIGFGLDNFGTITSLENGALGKIEGLGGINNGSGVGIENAGSINTITNGSIILGTGGVGSGEDGDQGGEGVGIGNVTSMAIDALTNSGTITGTGGAGNDFGGGSGAGVDNWGVITTLFNNENSIIEGIGGADSNVGGEGAGIYNEASGSIGTLTNTGTIEGVGGEAIAYSGGVGAGIDNFGNITTLENNKGSLIEGTGGSGLYGNNGVGLENEIGGSIGSITNIGTIEGNGGAGTSFSGNEYGVDNQGTITTLINSGLIEAPTDALYLDAGSTLGTLNNSGTIAGNIDNESTIALTITGGAGSQYGTFTGYNGSIATINSPAAPVVFNSGNLLLDDNISASNVVDSGATLLVNDAISSSPFSIVSGTLEVGDASHLSANLTSDTQVSGAGILSGYGTITGNVVNAGTVYPGGTAGSLHVIGNYTQNSDGTLEVNVNPSQGNQAPIAGINYNQLIVSGSATLDGKLLINANMPRSSSAYSVGRTYNFLSAQKIIGNFSEIALAGPYSQYLTASLAGITTDKNGGEVDSVIISIAGGTGAGTSTSSAGTGASTGGTGAGTSTSGAGTGASTGSTGAGTSTGGPSSNANQQTVANLEGSGPVNIDGGTLTDTGNGSQTYSGTITGSGGLSQSGSGTLILTGKNTFTGPTTIESGALEVGTASAPDASITSQVTVGTKGMLRGHGAVGSVQNNGTVSPGGTIGILTVNGTYTQATIAVLAIEITPNTIAGTGYDQLRVNGDATLSGALNIIVDTPDAGTSYKVGSIYNILTTTKGINGNFTSFSLSGNYASYLTASNIITDDKLVYQVMIVPVKSTLNTGSGQNLQNAPAFRSSRFYDEAMYAQNQSLFSVLSSTEGTQQGFWMHGLGSFGHAPNINFTYKGFTLGHGFAVAPNLIVGTALSNIYTNTNADNSSSVGETTIGGEIYGIYNQAGWTINNTVAAGNISNSAHRNLPEIATGRFKNNGSYEGVSLSSSYTGIESHNFFISPHAHANYLHTFMGAGQETNLGILNLYYGHISTNLAQLGGGITAGYQTFTRTSKLTVSLSLGGLATFGNTHAGSRKTLGLYSTNEAGLIAPIGAFTPSVSINLAGKNKPFTLSATWNGEFAEHSNSQAFMLQSGYKW